MDGIQFELFGRQFAWLNNWYSAELAIAYYLWTTISFLGVLQAAAARFRRRDLQIVPGRTLGYVAGIAVWIGAVGAFYHTQYRLIFVPGPATTEALVILGAAALTATAVTRIAAFTVHAVAGSTDTERAEYDTAV